MNERVMSLMLATGWLSIVLSGCAGAPDEKAAAARQSLDEARAAGADEYAKDPFTHAQDTLQSAMVEMEVQRDKLAFTRSYTESERLLEEAAKLANRAKVEAGLNKEQVRRSAEQLIQEARLVLDAARTSLTTAPSGKGTRADLAAMRFELDGLKQEIEIAQTAFDARDYLVAQSKAESVKQKAAEISGDIARARERRKTT